MLRRFSLSISYVSAHNAKFTHFLIGFRRVYIFTVYYFVIDLKYNNRAGKTWHHLQSLWIFLYITTFLFMKYCLTYLQHLE